MDAGGLSIPLSKDTYLYCWKHVYLGVQLRPNKAEIPLEANEKNNAATYQVILDCGGRQNNGTIVVLLCGGEYLDVDNYKSTCRFNIAVY